MALLVALVGLTTFVVPLIGTDPQVQGQAYWSPLTIVEQTQSGVLPLGAASAAATAADQAMRYENLLYGFLFAYGMLAAAFLAIVIGASVRVIRWTAGLCLGATLAMLLVALAMNLLGRFFFHSTFDVNGFLVLILILGAALLAMLTAAVVAFGSVRVRPLEVLRYE